MNRVRVRPWVRILLLGTLVTLISILVFVIWVLPGLVGDDVSVTRTVVPETRSTPRVAAPSRGQLQRAREKREAERLLQTLLSQQAALEAGQAATWGGADYAAALERLAAGDVAFAAARFTDAASHYTAVIELFQSLEAGKPRRLEAALAQGAAALEAYDGDTARQQFGVALAIDPANPVARSGLQRAATLEELASLLAQAAGHEEQRDWASALERYRVAVRLDPDSDAARAGETRTVAALAAQRFQAAMSQALVAIDDGSLEQARTALARARGLRPGATELRDAELRLQAALQARQIAGLRERALQLEAEERWAEAAESYQAVLAIDPQAQFARRGREQARQLAELHAQLDLYLDAPQRLQSAEPRSNAERLLQGTGALPRRGPRLVRKLEELDTLVRLAGTPVTVLIRSDNQTEVSIDRVGRFGRVTEQSLKLLPGSYRVRGTRVGYRDVRLQVDVAAGGAGQVIDVRCDEKI